MITQVWKYNLPSTPTIIDIPNGGIIRHVDEQNDGICMWIEVDPDRKKVSRQFEIFGTGHEIYSGMATRRVFLGTVKKASGALVFHVYERIS